jgi:hypothetical protein
MGASEPTGNVVIAEAYDPVDGTMHGWYAAFMYETDVRLVKRGSGMLHCQETIIMPNAAFWTLVAKLETAGCRP